MVEAHAFGQVLSDEAVGVLIAAALPGMVRWSEVELEAMTLLHLLVSMKLAPVVGGDCAELSGMTPGKHAQAAVGLLHCPGRKFADQHIARFPVHQRQYARPVLAHDRVDFPVADPGSVGRAIRTLCERTLARKPPATVVSPVSLPPLLPALAPQALVEFAAHLLVRHETPVDRFVADVKLPLPAQMSRNLLRAVIELQKLLNTLPLLRRVSRSLAGPTSSPPRHAPRMKREIAAPIRIFIAANFP